MVPISDPKGIFVYPFHKLMLDICFAYFRVPELKQIQFYDSLTSKRVIMQTEQPTKCLVPLQKGRARLGP